MTRREDFRLRAERLRSRLYPEKGVGVLVSRGCLGTMVGDPRASMFATAKVILGPWAWEVSLTWKEADR